MDGMHRSVPPPWFGVDRPTSFGPVHSSAVRGSAHADFGDHRKIAIYAEVADATRGTVTYTALRHEFDAGHAQYHALWAEQRFAEGWLRATPILPEDGSPSVGGPVQIVRVDDERQPWHVGTYPPTLPGPSRRLIERSSSEPAKTLAHRGLRDLHDRWGPDLLVSHGFDPSRAIQPRRHAGGRPGTPDHVVARVAAIIDSETRLGPPRGALRRTYHRLQELDGQWEWTYPRVRSMHRRAADLWFLTVSKRITAGGVAALDPSDRALLHPDALR
jgi:hypothetical protein